MKKETHSSTPLLELDHLAVTFYTPQGTVHAVRETSLKIQRGEVLGLVGESGCGKSTIAWAIMGYFQSLVHMEGTIRFKGKSFTEMPPSELRGLRGRRIAMVYQDVVSSLNPTMRVGPQLEEVLRENLNMGKQQARHRVIELFENVNLAEPERVGQRYPHELSGGMQQRVVIAMALACDPELLIMDEPTTGLDVTTEATILDLISELRQRVNAGIIWISHNLGIIARIADRVAVMYAGQIVEQAPVKALFRNPSHPYTVGLLNCVPGSTAITEARTKLATIPGTVYDSKQPTTNTCLFEPRCSITQDSCKSEIPQFFDAGDHHQSRCSYWSDVRPDIWGKHEPVIKAPEQTKAKPLLTVTRLQHFYGREQHKIPFIGPVGLPPVRAVVDANFNVGPKQTVGIVGESGSGKSTVARNVVGLLSRSGGDIHLQGALLEPRVEKRSRKHRAELGIIFQNPAAALNPKLHVRHSILRSLWKFPKLRGRVARERAAQLLESVGMDASYLGRLPSELSGGQQQRIALAAALAGDPQLIVADEPVSALDVSVQAQVLNLLREEQQNNNISYIFISHDLGVVRYMADEIIVLYAGHIAESGPANSILKPPSHPYTETLLSAIPVPDPEVIPSRIRLDGPVPSLRQIFKGCFFAGRCPRKIGPVCDGVMPPTIVNPNSPSHIIYCHIPLEQLSEIQTTSTDL